MRYQVDQSGKIEDTAKDTIIAYANTTQYAVKLPRRLKRKIQEIFRLHGFTSLFVYYLFSVGVFYLLSNLEKTSEVVIDLEYPGKDQIMNAWISEFLEKNGIPAHHITFARIGSRPRAHYAAKDVFDRKKLSDRVLNLEDIIQALKKTDGRLRECLSTLVDARPRSLKTKYHKRDRKSTRKSLKNHNFKRRKRG